MIEHRSTLQAAIDYARMGYAVFPCTAGGKRPILKRGLHAASTDSKLITRWWQRWSEANLAILPPEDVLVLDFDDNEIADTWTTQYLELRAAPCTRTPRGGAHYWLKFGKHDEHLTTRTKAAGGAVDLRGLGRAYLVAPPSSSATGTYKWERALVSPPYLPLVSSNLLAAVTPSLLPKPKAVVITEVGSDARKYALGALRSEHDLVAATFEGARNDRLNRAAYALAGYVALELLTFDEVESVLMTAAQTCGLGETESAQTIQSGLSAGHQIPRRLPKSLLERKS